MSRETIGKLISGSMLRHHVDQLPDFPKDVLELIKTDYECPNCVPVLVMRDALKLLGIGIEEAEPALWESFRQYLPKDIKKRPFAALWENEESMGKYIESLKKNWNK